MIGGGCEEEGDNREASSDTDFDDDEMGGQDGVMRCLQEPRDEAVAEASEDQGLQYQPCEAGE